MKIAVVGGGPAGLYFSILMRKVAPDCSVTVFERNQATDAFGFGVVFSDETLTVFENADPESYSSIASRFARWTDIDIRHRGVVTRSGGHGFAALGRRELLGILQSRALSLGVDIRFSCEAPSLDELGWADVVVGADGASSAIRAARRRDFLPSLDPRHCRYMWLGTDLVFDAFKFFIRETEHGVFQAHAYPYDDSMSTFIVETHEDVWRRAGLDQVSASGLAPGVSDQIGVDFCANLFAEELEGHGVVANNSKWINFVTVRNRRWSADNVVLLGDAAHTAHFSIGSGTKLAMEDAAALAWAFRNSGDDVGGALASYEAERRPVVESTQRAAQASLEWFEGIGRYVDQERTQFAFNLLTRSRRVTYDNLRLRDPGFVRVGRFVVRGSGGRVVAATDVHAAAVAWAYVAESGGRFGDGHVLGRRRCAERLPSRASRVARARGRGARDDRDAVRLGRRDGSRPGVPECIRLRTFRHGNGLSTLHIRTEAARLARSSATRVARARRS